MYTVVIGSCLVSQVLEMPFIKVAILLEPVAHTVTHSDKISVRFRCPFTNAYKRNFFNPSRIGVWSFLSKTFFVTMPQKIILNTCKQKRINKKVK